MGIRLSTGPSNGTGHRPKPDKPMSKTQMKLLLPELYEQMYGKDSDYYKLQQEFKKLKQ